MAELAKSARISKAPTPTPDEGLKRSGPITDLALTLPIFVGYHLGVVFLPVRNAADVVTRELIALADNNLLLYSGLTLAIGAAFVAVMLLTRKRHALRWQAFATVAAEGVVYAIAMRLLAGWVVGRITMGALGMGPFTGLVMSMGAGFYEEIAFRVGLYGLGAKGILTFFPIESRTKKLAFYVGWAVLGALVFSGWHYVGALGDPFQLSSFVFRAVCGLVFTAIYQFRGFAPAVWTHALYDVWVLVF